MRTNPNGRPIYKKFTRAFTSVTIWRLGAREARLADAAAESSHPVANPLRCVFTRVDSALISMPSCDWAFSDRRFVTGFVLTFGSGYFLAPAHRRFFGRIEILYGRSQGAYKASGASRKS